MIDMSDMVIATPFDDGQISKVPNNSNREEITVFNEQV